MFEAEEAGVGEEDLEAVLSAALGVRVDACRLVAAMETTTTGKITYGEEGGRVCVCEEVCVFVRESVCGWGWSESQES